MTVVRVELDYLDSLADKITIYRTALQKLAGGDPLYITAGEVARRALREADEE